MTAERPAGKSLDVPRWVKFAPDLFRHRDPRLAIRWTARRLSRTEQPVRDVIDSTRREGLRRAQCLPARFVPAAVFCVNVLCDLRAQGWLFRLRRTAIFAAAPVSNGEDVLESKARLRSAHLVERDAQLRQPAVVRFIRDMEQTRLHGGEWHSIFSLMRDGRQLAAALNELLLLPTGAARGEAARAVIRPYIQVARPKRRCAFTGIDLFDIWRYFRHTWTTTYQSTPGRKLYFLVRDAGAPNHPVIGIGALGSPIVQLSVRDEWIGWTGDQVVDGMRLNPTRQWARWLDDSLSSLTAGIFVGDFIKRRELTRGALKRPSAAAIDRLAAIAQSERKLHVLYPERGQHKRAAQTNREAAWAAEAHTHLFRSKRAGALAELLHARQALEAAGFVHPTPNCLKNAIGKAAAVKAIHTIVRHIKATHVGVDMMDITVCGAVAPYSRLLGGKLVSLLMASPEVRAEYARRYKRAESVIASSMAGRPVTRPPRLVLLGTTSLYAAGASQYHRLCVGADKLGGKAGRDLAYLRLGQTAGYGSYHFSQETMQAIEPLIRQRQQGRAVNSIFGEGVNPKLRKVRSALDAVGLPSDLLLQHGSPRLVFAVPLATNFRDVLLGRSSRPRYVVPDTTDSTSRIAAFWCERWLAKRIENPDVLADVARESISYPVKHGARVPCPHLDGELAAGPDPSPSHNLGTSIWIEESDASSGSVIRRPRSKAARAKAPKPIRWAKAVDGNRRRTA